MAEERIGVPGLHIKLFGAPRVLLDGKDVSAFTSVKVQALFFYLAVTGKRHRRSTLAAMFWPEVDEQKARSSLRNGLSILRKLFPDHVDTDRESAAVHRSDLWLDTAQFKEMLNLVGDQDANVLQHEAALALYTGDFLAGFFVQDAPPFDEWASATRLHLHNRAVSALLQLTHWQLERQDVRAGLDLLNRLLTMEPGSEVAHRLKMRLLAQLGHRSAAIRQFEECRRYLAEELGVDPDPESMALYQLVLEGKIDREPASLTDLTATAATRPVLPGPQTGIQTVEQQPAPGPSGFPQLDRGEMPVRVALRGRDGPLANLLQGLGEQTAALFVIAGLGGVGKTALAAEAVHQLAEVPLAENRYDCIIWRSVQNAPPFDHMVQSWLRALAPASIDSLPTGRTEALERLFSLLQQRRCLLILDNFESVLNDRAGATDRTVDDANYRRLAERMAWGHHQSCLLLTTRTLPGELLRWQDNRPGVRFLRLEGIAPREGIELLQAGGVHGAEPMLASLVTRYSGNPLALKLVADTITEFYAGDVARFPGEEAPLFDDIRQVLDQQFGRLSDQEREILIWLALKREPVDMADLLDRLVNTPRQGEFVAAIRSLKRSSLLSQAGQPETGDVPAPEQGNRRSLWTLHNVVMEYVGDRVLVDMLTELEDGRSDLLHRFALREADSPQYIQDAQRRLYLKPLADLLLQRWGMEETRLRLRTLLDTARGSEGPAHGYVGANVIHLWLELEPSLDGEDFSQLSLRQADLRTAMLNRVDLRNADLTHTRFADSFGAVWSLSLSPDGRYLAASADGDVLLHRMPDLQPHAVLRGHTNMMVETAFSADSRHLASIGRDGALSVWDVESGTLLVSRQMKEGILDAVAFGKGGDYLAYADGDGVISVWAWHSDRLIGRLETKSVVSALAFDGDGRVLAGVGREGDIQCWDTATQQLLFTLDGSGGRGAALAASGDCAVAVAASEDKTLRLWDLRNRALSDTLTAGSALTLAVAISAGGRYAVTAGTDNTIRLWDMHTKQLVRVFHGHHSWVKTVAFAVDGQYLVSGGYDQSIRVWDIRSGRQHHYLKGFLRRIHLAVFSPDSALLAGTTIAGTVYLWRREESRAWRILQHHTAPVRNLAFSPNSTQLATGGDDGRICLYNTQTGALQHDLHGHAGFVRSVTFDRTGRHLVSAGDDNTLRIWDSRSGSLVRTISGIREMMLNDMSFHPQRHLLVYGTQKNSVDLRDLDTGVVIHSLPAAKPITVTAFDPCGRYLAAGGPDGCITLWRLTSDDDDLSIALVNRFQETRGRVWRMLFSPDGAALVWNCEGRDGFILNVATGEVRPLPGQQNALCMAFTPDGRRLVTDGPDHAVVIHDVATGRIDVTLQGHRSDLASIAVSRDGEVVASADTLGMVQLWDADTGHPRRRLDVQGPYEGMKIAGAAGLTQDQLSTLISLGAVTDQPNPEP